MTSTDYTIPALPLGGGEITILRWLKRPGEQVAAGEPLLIVLTDRAEIAIPAPTAAVLARAADEGSTHPAGAAVAAFVGESTAAANALPATHAPRATPLARRIAAAHGVALETLLGSGPGGRIVRADVLAAVAPAPEAAAPAQPVPAQAPAAPVAYLAARDDTSVLTAMHADLSAAAALCARLGPAFARRGLTIDLATCVAQAIAGALACYPLLNGWWDGERIIVPRRVQLAYQLAGRAGTIPDAQDRNLQGIARAMAQPAPAAAPTFHFFASSAEWHQPPATGTAALVLGAACVRPTVLAANQPIAARLGAMLTLAYDARAVDQAYADAFLGAVVAQLARAA
jgi:pyruvate/2-oxoglutarate dehydrogenase complex dihydrolipoamide acyltransferase (E2) component